MVQTNKGRSERVMRIGTGVVLAAAVVALIALQGAVMLLGLAIIMGLSIQEMYGAFAHRGARVNRALGVCYAVISPVVYVWLGAGALAPMTVLACMVALLIVVLRGEPDFESAVAMLFPLIYPGFMIALMFPLVGIEPPLLRTVALALCFVLAVANDLAAYSVGVRFGKRKLCPALSPKKTVEGALAGMAGSVAIALIVPMVAEYVTVVVPQARAFAAVLPPLWHFALIGVVGGVAAPVGDLTASMVKRYCGIKDFGVIFPGHGGMLDRVDSIVFTGAIVYMYFAVFTNVL